MSNIIDAINALAEAARDAGGLAVSLHVDESLLGTIRDEFNVLAAENPMIGRVRDADGMMVWGITIYRAPTFQGVPVPCGPLDGLSRLERAEVEAKPTPLAEFNRFMERRKSDPYDGPFYAGLPQAQKDRLREADAQAWREIEEEIWAPPGTKPTL